MMQARFVSLFLTLVPAGANGQAGPGPSAPAPAPPALSWVSVCAHALTQVVLCVEKSCKPFLSYPCAPFGCARDRKACATRCTADVDCATGYACHAASQQCAPQSGNTLRASCSGQSVQ